MEAYFLNFIITSYACMPIKPTAHLWNFSITAILEVDSLIFTSGRPPLAAQQVFVVSKQYISKKLCKTATILGFALLTAGSFSSLFFEGCIPLLKTHKGKKQERLRPIWNSKETELLCKWKQEKEETLGAKGLNNTEVYLCHNCTLGFDTNIIWNIVTS